MYSKMARLRKIQFVGKSKSFASVFRFILKALFAAFGCNDLQKLYTVPFVKFLKCYDPCWVT